MPLTEAEFSRQLAIALPQVRAYARKITEDHSEADDLMQDVAVIALHNQGKYEDRGTMTAWLVTTMQFRHQHRRAKAYTRYETPYADSIDGRVFSDPADIGITLKRVIAFMDEMPAHHTQVLTLDALGHSQDEITVAADCPLGTVKSRLHRARAALREEFGEI